MAILSAAVRALFYALLGVKVSGLIAAERDIHFWDARVPAALVYTIYAMR